MKLADKLLFALIIAAVISFGSIILTAIVHANSKLTGILVSNSSMVLNCSASARSRTPVRQQILACISLSGLSNAVITQTNNPLHYAFTACSKSNKEIKGFVAIVSHERR